MKWVDESIQEVFIRQKDMSQPGCYKKTKHPKFSPCSFSGKFEVLFFFSRNTRFEIRAFVALPTKCLFDELSKFIILLMFFSHKEPTWKPIQVCTVQHVESLFWVDQSYFAYTEKTQKVIIIFQSCVTCRMKATKLHQWRMKLFFQNNVINVSFNAIQIIKTVNYPASFYFDLFLYSTYGVLSWNLISDYMFSEEYEKKYVLVFPN